MLRALVVMPLALGSFLSPRPLAADFGGLPSIDFGAVCTPGDVFRACASVAAWSEFDPVTSEYFLYVQVRESAGETWL